MEDNNNNNTKRREGGSGSGADSSEPALTESHSGRRRGGAFKRKSNNSSSFNNLSSATFNSNPSKRFMREKAAIASIHNGPCTRAAAASASSVVSTVLIEPLAVNVKSEDESSVNEEWKALENAIEAEYEVVRSRDAGVHVVPNHCGWFSWTKNHPLEVQALQSFFNGKAEDRNPDTYMEIRNWIVKKFHANPNKQIEIKDLEDLNVGDLDARQEVMEFLDYWGLINFHPLTQTETDSSVTKTEEKESDRSNELAEKLFKFETMQWCPPVVQKPATPKPLTPKLLPEPTIPDDSVKPEGPSVEYHCNSCSTDCSRKRYHCQKQADFDLCTECFNNGKLGSDMSLFDFILMEPAEAPGLSSATWTDQETLLLLEALELYKENWNEIAEHVATKTKDQCILRFVQMPIEDSFFDSDVDSKEDHSDSAHMGLVAPKEGPETTDGAHCANNEGQTPTCIEKSKPEDASEDKGCQEVDESVALKALKEAFEAVGSLPEPGFEHTFADAGNPVMAMAVFLARFVGSDAATASSRSSLKALSSNSPSIELATRHCFILEDSQSDMKDLVGSESTAFDMGNRDSQKDGKSENVSVQKGAEDLAGDLRNCESKSNESVKGDSIPSTKGIDEEKSNTTKVKGTKKTGRGTKKSPRNSSSNGETRVNLADSAIKLSQEVQNDLDLAGSGNENSGPKTMDEDSIDKNRKPEDLVEKAIMKDHLEEPIKKKDTVETDHIKEDSVEKDEKLFPVPSSIERCKDESASQVEPSNVVYETDLTPKSDPEVSGSLEGDAIKTEVQNSGESKVNLDIDKVKCAAITTLAAAAVKAQLLADHEEDEIKKLAVFLIDKQLRKLELKMALFEDLGSVTMRVKEQLERTRQKLYQERAQIIAARLGSLPSSHPRPMSSAMPPNRNAINFANSGLRPHFGMNPLRPLIGRPTMPFPQAPTNQFPPSTLGRSGLRPQSQESQDNISSVRMK